MNASATEKASRDGVGTRTPLKLQDVLTAAGIRSTAQELLEPLDERSRRILTRRFGLDGHSPKTLQAIGAEEGITRERVRQVEHAILTSFHEASKGAAGLETTPMLPRMREALVTLLGALGGVALEESLVSRLRLVKDADRAALRLVLKSLPSVRDVRETTRVARHYRLREQDLADRVIDAARRILQEAQRLVPDAALFRVVRERLSVDLAEDALRSVLSIARDIVRTPFGEWGLRSWAEATPRGVGDKAYVVLKRAGGPRHFTEITKEINAVRFDRRVAHAQTVHNELIRDERFVLVGRGIYALREWGHTPGTVADVLERLLRTARAPLPREALVAQVLHERIVKRNTVLLALQDRAHFHRLSDGRYTLAHTEEATPTSIAGGRTGGGPSTTSGTGQGPRAKAPSAEAPRPVPPEEDVPRDRGG